MLTVSVETVRTELAGPAPGHQADIYASYSIESERVKYVPIQEAGYGNKSVVAAYI